MAATLAVPPGRRKAAPAPQGGPATFRQIIVMIGKQGEKTAPTEPCGALDRGGGRTHYPPLAKPPLLGRPASHPGYGAVAQLGERRVRNAEVRSSILLGSTILFPYYIRTFLFSPRSGRSPVMAAAAIFIEAMM